MNKNFGEKKIELKGIKFKENGKSTGMEVQVQN